jgi:hypothetical protein
MNVTLDDLRRIAEVEFNDLIADVESLEEKVRLFIADTSYIDVWLSRKLPERFGYHWERGHIDSTFYRYDNFPNTAWRNVETYPRHFHNGSQTHVEAAPFSADILEGFRDFLRFVKNKKAPPPDESKTRVDESPDTPPREHKGRFAHLEIISDEPPDNPTT